MKRRISSVLCVLLALLLMQAPLGAAQDVDEAEETEEPSDADCAEAINVQTVRGTILETERLELYEGDDHYRAVLRIDDGNDNPEDDQQIDFLVFGKGDLLEIDSPYVVTYSEFATGEQTFESRAAFLGNDLTCAPESTIAEVLEDGSTVSIDVSGFDLPSIPVTPRQVAIAFGVLAVVTFLFREPRTAH